jgi:hypothetical protein
MNAPMSKSAPNEHFATDVYNTPFSHLNRNKRTLFSFTFHDLLIFLFRPVMR